MVRSLDFTFDKYHELIEAILRAGYLTVTVEQYLKDRTILESPRVVILRHDVDVRPENALHMGRMESELGVDATYYFRMVRRTYVPEIVRELHSLGHEIGYHYETLSKTGGNRDAAISLFEEELQTLRELCPVSTICMHGRSMSPWDNRTLWDHYDFRSFDLLGECYLSIDYSRVRYLTDTGRTWGPTAANLRDRSPAGEQAAAAKSSDDLIRLFTGEGDGHWLLQAHPNKWARGLLEWQFCLIREWGITLGKLAYKRLRSTSPSPGRNRAGSPRSSGP